MTACRIHTVDKDALKKELTYTNYRWHCREEVTQSSIYSTSGAMFCVNCRGFPAERRARLAAQPANRKFRQCPPSARRNPQYLPPLLAIACLLAGVGSAYSADATDWITTLPREPVHVAGWPGGKEVAICFVLCVEVWSYGHGPKLPLWWWRSRQGQIPHGLCGFAERPYCSNFRTTRKRAWPLPSGHRQPAPVRRETPRS